MDVVLQDLRYALRTLRRSPAFTAMAVLTLALGIGLNSAIFTIVKSLILDPLPVEDPDRLTVLYAQVRTNQSYTNFSHADYKDFREASDVFAGVTDVQPVLVGLGLGNESQLVWGEAVSGTYFDVLGVRPALGRGFRAVVLIPASNHRLAVSC